jgi:hypothetical protein
MDRDEVLSQAIEECFQEIYSKTQPKLDFQGYLTRIRNGETKDDDFFMHYYMNSHELDYIVNKYIRAYKIEDPFKDYVQLLIDCAVNGYVDEEYQEDPQTKEKIRRYVDKPSLSSVVGQENLDIFIDFLNNRLNFYRFNREAEKFRNTIYLGPSPNSNYHAVEKYWQNKGISLTIDPREHSEEWFEEEMYMIQEEEL